jgi:hypothetical protein
MGMAGPGIAPGGKPCARAGLAAAVAASRTAERNRRANVIEVTFPWRHDDRDRNHRCEAERPRTGLTGRRNQSPDAFPKGAGETAIRSRRPRGHARQADRYAGDGEGDAGEPGGRRSRPGDEPTCGVRVVRQSPEKAIKCETDRPAAADCIDQIVSGGNARDVRRGSSLRCSASSSGLSARRGNPFEADRPPKGGSLFPALSPIQPLGCGSRSTPA